MKYFASALVLCLVATPILSEPSAVKGIIPQPVPIEVAAINVPGNDIEEARRTRRTPAEIDKDVKANMRAGILLLMILGELGGKQY
jgi:hypothetical protein